jgi:hypothetical protein
LRAGIQPAAALLRRLVPARALEIEMLLAVPDARATLSLAFEAGVVLDMVVAHFLETGSEAAALRLVAALAGSLDESDPRRLQHRPQG